MKAQDKRYIDEQIMEVRRLLLKRETAMEIASEQSEDEDGDLGTRVEALEARLQSHMGKDDQHDIVGVLEEPVVTTFRDVNGNITLNLQPAATPVQHLSISNAGTGDAVALTATADLGGDSNISIDLGPQGTGTVSENGTPLALGAGEAAPDTSGLAGATKTFADAIVVLLQNARICA
jgi:hypothetical protein